MSAPTTTTPAWIWGGGLLLASAMLPLIGGNPSVIAPGLTSTIFAWCGMLAFSAAMIVFALGIAGRGSLVARGRAGVIALIVLGLISPVMWVLTSLLPYSTDDPEVFVGWGYVDLALRFAAALAAVVAIGRAHVLPPPWNWSPAWGLAAIVVVDVLMRVLVVADGSASSQEMLEMLFGMSSLTAVAVPSLLGILAIVLGSRADPRATVPVYPPAS